MEPRRAIAGSNMPRGIGRALCARFESREHRATVIALAGLLIVGLSLRLLLFFAWRPALLGFADSSVYLEAAKGQFASSIPNTVFFDTMRPAGYPIFLRILHGFTDHLTVVVLVQHALGLATAVLLYLTVRRIGGPPWLGLFPAAIVLLEGTEIFVEHAALTEALYIFLTAAALYAAMRSLNSDDPGWAALSGGLFGAAADVRFLGLVVVPTVAVWMLAARRDSLPGRFLHAGVCLAAGALLVGSYVYAQRQSTGYTGITRAGVWNLYGRIAPIADCTKFTPPPGTEVLCESTPPSQRPGQSAYLFASSPATRAFGFPDYGGYKLSSVDDNAKVGALARTVILHQPLDYLKTVARDSVRYVRPDHRTHGQDGLTVTEFVRSLEADDYSNFVMERVIPGYYRAGGYSVNHGRLSALETYERHTRIEGPLFLVMLLLALGGPFVASGRLRTGTTLFTIVALELLITPVATTSYDARLAIPALGVLGASAALGGWSLWAFLRTRRGVQRAWQDIRQPRT